MKNNILIMSICAFSLGISLKAQDEKVIVIVNAGVYSELQLEISRYIDDISSNYKVSLYETNGGTAQDLRNFIISQKDSLVGCIFIGNMPVFIFEIKNDIAANSYTSFPCDLYFMDLDGNWSDEDNNGLYDSHTDGNGDVAPEIFVGRIDASHFPGDQYQVLRNYFNRDHNYWIGNFSFRKTGLAYTDIDWKYNSDVNEGMRYLFGIDNYQYINDERVSKKDYHENRLINNQYEFIQVALHSAHNYHWFSNLCGGVLYSDEILNSSPEALGYNLFACSACDYTQNNFLGGAYIFSNSEKSLAVIGSTKKGAMLQFYAFYQPLGKNRPIGQAHKEWFEYIAPYSEYEKSWHYGMTLLGDPLIKFNLGNANHGPLVDAGSNQTILWPDSVCELNGIIKDDGLPVGSKLTYNWEMISGLKGVSFDNENALSTSVHLDSLGNYRMKLNVSDGEFTGEDFLNIKASRINREGETSRPSNGITLGLIVRDSLAYFTSTRDLVIMNIKDKSNPFLVSSYEFEKQINIYDHCKLALDSDYAYIASGQKNLYIIDISDPCNPQQVGFYSSYDPNECINDVKVTDNIAYVTDSIRGLVILDIHDKSKPVFLGNCATNGTAEAVSIQGNYAFIADGSNGLRIIDISNKRIPKEIGYYNNSFRSFGDNSLKQNIQVSGNYVYISYEHPSKSGCISIIDISDKINPIEITCFEIYYLGFYVEGNHLYYIGTCDHDVFGIFDITNKSKPKLIESYKNEDVYFQGNVCIYESNHFVYLSGQYRGRGLNIFHLNLENTAPYVYAGDDIENCQNSITLKGIMYDDKFPLTSGSSYFWEKISGPGNVYFADPTALNTKVYISNNGKYIFRLSASDGELTGFDDIRISYYSAPPEIDDIEVCENSHIPDLSATGENIRWYGDANLSNLLYSGNSYNHGKILPGLYKYFVTQTMGECESKADTVILTIVNVPTAPITQNVSVCENQPVPNLIATEDHIRWYSDSMLINLLHTGSSFSSGRTEPGTYVYFITQTISGCESEVSAINLSINPIPSITLGKDTTILRNQKIILGPFNQKNFYFWNDGSDNPYLEMLGNEAGIGNHAVSVIVTDTNSCSFSDTINVNVTRCEVTSAINKEACKRYTSPSGNYTWMNPGLFLDTIPAGNGCDSIITIDLTILTADTSVTQNQEVLAANAIGATYQWIKYDNGYLPIDGETHQIFTGEESGYYAVIVSQNGCIDTSGIFYINITELQATKFEHNITLYPNPSDGSITLDMGAVYPNIDITITEMDGRIILKDKMINSRVKELQLPEVPGSYVLIITSGNDKAMFKVIKK